MKRTRGWCVLLLLCCVSVAIISPPVWADDAADAEAARMEAEEHAVPEGGDDPGVIVDVGIFDGGLQFHAAYHVNPYYRGEDGGIEGAGPEAGLVFHLDPHVRVAFPFSELLYMGLYAKINLTSVILFDTDAIDDTKTVAHPYVNAKVRYNPTENSSIALSDTYQRANIEDDITGDGYGLNIASLDAALDMGASTRGGIWYKNTMLHEDSGSLLFDFMENAGGVNISRVMGRTADDQDITAGLHLSVGQKEFDSGDFVQRDEDTDTFVQADSRDNPKTHTYHGAAVSCGFPLGVMKAGCRVGWKHRSYEVEYDRDDETDNLSVSATLGLPPMGALRLNLAAGYSVTDTVIFNETRAQQVVFDSLDPLLNNLEPVYREQEVSRVGMNGQYRFSERTSGGFSAVYQRSAADAEEDLTQTSGESGVDPDDLDEERISFGLNMGHRVTSSLELGVSYQYGVVQNDGDEVYDYSAAALTAKFGAGVDF